MTTAAEMVAAAKAQIPSLTPEQLAERLGDGSTLIVDLREPAELANTGVIPGAVHAPRGMLEFFADPTSPYHRPEFDPQRPTVLYCAGGGRSALAAMTLRELGYSQVEHLDGGMGAWTSSGQKTQPQQA